MTKTPTNETRDRQHEHHAERYAAYRAEHHAEVNQAKRLMRHLHSHPEDPCALAALGTLPMEVLMCVPGAVEAATRRAH